MRVMQEMLGAVMHTRRCNLCSKDAHDEVASRARMRFRAMLTHEGLDVWLYYCGPGRDL